MNFVYKVIIKLFRKLGYRIQKIDNQFSDIPSGLVGMNDCLKRLYNLEVEPNFVVDVGAAKGDWSLLALKYFTDSRYILVEPIKDQIDNMPYFLKNSKKIGIVNAVLGEDDGLVHFNITGDKDGSGVYNESDDSIILPTKKLDSLINTEGSVLLKLDTHGYEIPIFRGAEKLLSNTIAIIVEVYGFNVSPTGLLFHEISDYLFKKGFRLFDIVDIMRRPKDQAFWQADAVYLKKDHPIFNDSKYN